MKTRLLDREVPRPESPWDEISPDLWMGGHYWVDLFGQLRLVVVDEQFDLVISLFSRNGHGPPPGVEHRALDIPDGPLSLDQIGQVRDLAVLAAEAVRGGRATLVRCQAGYNRSGLVVAQTLIELGHDAGEAIALVRRHRSPWALHNLSFEQYLHAGLG